MHKWFTGGLIGTLAIVMAAASPAAAAGPYARTEPIAVGWAGSNGGTWSATAAADVDGTFSLAASVDEPGVAADGRKADADAQATVYQPFTLAAGSYKAVVTWTGLTGSASGARLGNAHARVGVELDCDCLTGGGGDDIVIQSEGPPMWTVAPESVSGGTALTWTTFTLPADGSVVVGAIMNASATSGTLAGLHGGAGCVTFSGTVASITVEPA